MGDTILVTRWEEGERLGAVWSHQGDTWVFVWHGDPGLDYAVRPGGRLVPTYEPYGGCPHGVPADLWEAVELVLRSQWDSDVSFDALEALGVDGTMRTTVTHAEAALWGHP